MALCSCVRLATWRAAHDNKMTPHAPAFSLTARGASAMSYTPCILCIDTYPYEALLLLSGVPDSRLADESVGAMSQRIAQLDAQSHIYYRQRSRNAPSAANLSLHLGRFAMSGISCVWECSNCSSEERHLAHYALGKRGAGVTGVPLLYTEAETTLQWKVAWGSAISNASPFASAARS